MTPYSESESESESEWALLARYVYTYEEFVIVTKLHSATEWQQRDRTQTTEEQYTNIQTIYKFYCKVTDIF